MKRILIIDDDSRVRKMLREMLEPEEFEVLEAPDGKEGMDRHRESPCDLAIIDIFMPEQDGIETINQLHRVYPDVKIIAISGGTPKISLDFLPIAKTMGADRTIAKPIRREELLDAVKAVLPDEEPS
jgi:CheY-like chemotaxis protein